MKMSKKAIEIPIEVDTVEALAKIRELVDATAWLAELQERVGIKSETLPAHTHPGERPTFVQFNEQWINPHAVNSISGAGPVCYVMTDEGLRIDLPFPAVEVVARLSGEGEGT